MEFITNKPRVFISALIFLFVLLFAIFNINKAKNHEYDKSEVIGALCKGKLWLEAVKKTGDLPFATFEGDTLCIAGGIFSEGVESAIRIINSNKIRNIMISSSGGSATAAMDLAEEIIKNNIDVYVTGPCFSSCANYIFMAGANKYILDGAVVAWHGAPRIKEGQSDNQKNVALRHIDFFNKIRVDERMTHLFPCDLQHDQNFTKAVNENAETRGVLWTYTTDIMRKDFNIRNLVALWHPASTTDIRSITRFSDIYKNVFLSKGCG